VSHRVNAVFTPAVHSWCVIERSTTALNVFHRITFHSHKCMSTGRSQHSPNVITAVDNVITERRVITPHDYTYLSLTQWDSIRVKTLTLLLHNGSLLKQRREAPYL